MMMLRKIPSRLIPLLLFCCLGGPVLAAGHETILITEVVYDAVGEDGLEEWIELANVGDRPASLGGFVLGDEETVGGGEGMVRFPEQLTLAPGEVVVVAQSAAAFRRRYGRPPTFELQESDPAVPVLAPDLALGEGVIALANGGDEVLLLNAEGMPVDGLSYGDSARVLRPPAPAVARGASLERFPAGCDTDAAADWRAQARPTPGELPEGGECAGRPPSAEVLPIGVVQGAGERSPFVGQSVTVRGIAIDTQADLNAAGRTFYTLFLQNAPEEADGDPATSDGLPIFLGQTRPLFPVGAEIQASGVITEYFGLTEMAEQDLSLQLLDTGRTLPLPVSLGDPGAGGPDLLTGGWAEPLEGMLVAIEEGVVVGPTFETDSGCGLAVVPAGLAARFIRHEAEVEMGPVVPVMHHAEADCADLPPVKVGDRLTGLRGPLVYNFDRYRLVNQDPFALEVFPADLPAPPPPLQPGPGQIAVATLNVENFFDSQDDTGRAAEPKPSPEEIEVKQAKIAAAIGRLLGCPTLVAIQEVEKRALLEALALAVETACGFRYEISHEESFDGRGIDVALLSDPRQTVVDGVRLRPACSPVPTEVVIGRCPAGEYPLFSRPPLQVDLMVSGRPLKVFVIHFKSKRGGEVETQPEREEQARFVGRLVEESADWSVIVLGDFNDYDRSPPMQLLTVDGRLVNVLQRLPEEEQYTFNFGGISQMIDGILVSPELVPHVAGVQIHHVNADFPDRWAVDLSPERLLFKSSDHDPPVVLLNWTEPEVEATAEPVIGPDPSRTPALEPTLVVPGGNGVNFGLGGWLWTVIIGGIVFLVGAAAIWLWRR